MESEVNFAETDLCRKVSGTPGTFGEDRRFKVYGSKKPPGIHFAIELFVVLVLPTPPAGSIGNNPGGLEVAKLSCGGGVLPGVALLTGLMQA